ncbi:MAG: hypothetical protein ACRDDX_13670 [Cellulosilyticaceae bacterium]
MKKYICMWCTLLLLSLMCSIPLLAEVTKKNTIEYEFNHKKYEGTQPFIEYNGKPYVAIDELAQLLGLYVQYKDSKLYISDVQKGETNSLYFENAIIKKVDQEHKLIAMTIGEHMAKQEQTVTVSVGKDVRITCPLMERVFPFDVLQEGMKVSMWCIPQKGVSGGNYKASHIEIVAEDGLLTGLLPIIENAVIKEMNKEEQYIVVTVSNPIEKEKQIMIYIDTNINIKEEGGRASYGIEHLAVGQHITIITNGIMTHSMPVQTVGLEIIIQNILTH